MTKSDDFQRRNMSSVGRILGTGVHRIKDEGDDVAKSDDFQKRCLSSVGRI